MTCIQSKKSEQTIYRPFLGGVKAKHLLSETKHSKRAAKFDMRIR